MPDDGQGQRKGPFIPIEIRPRVGLDLAQSPPVGPSVSKEELRRRALEAQRDMGADPLDADPPPRFWERVFVRNPRVPWTLLDDEAVVISLDHGVYYTLNRVGTVIWELLADDRPLHRVLSALRERFDAPEELIRHDLIALVERLRAEGLIIEGG